MGLGKAGFFSVLGIAMVMATGSSQAAGEWPGFRGPNHNGTAAAVEVLDVDSLALNLAWKTDLGSGYSAIAVDGTRLVTMFVGGENDVLAAFDTVSGEEIWRYDIAETYPGHNGSHDGPVSTPTIGDGRAFGLGPRGHLFAVSMEDGSELWSTHLVEDHAAVEPFYGFSTSPLLAEGVLVVEIGAPEGKAIAGFNPEDGTLLWTAGDDKIEYHSPIVVSIGEERQVVAVGQDNIYGLNAADGKVLWRYQHAGDERAIGGMTIVPLPAGEGRLFLMNKVDSSVMLEVKKKKKKYEIAELWSNGDLKNSYVPPVYLDGHIYGMSNRIFTSLDAATGEINWRSREPGDGFPVLVGNRLVIITKPGSLHVAEASPEGYRELAQLDLFGEHSWSEVAYAGGHLYARSMAHLARIDTVAGGGELAAEATGSSLVSEFALFLQEVDDADDKMAVVDTYLASQKSYPIIGELGDVHFVYRGEAADVGIVGDMIGFRREEPMTQIAGTDLFYYSTQMEPEAALSYGYIIDYADPVADPLNAQDGTGLFGEVSWFAMPSWRAAEFAAGPDAATMGTMESITWESEILEGTSQAAEIYLPAGYEENGDKRYPVLYVHNGKDALEKGNLRTALDQLADHAVEPLIMVFIMADEENPPRGIEDMEAYVNMVATELVPVVDDSYRTRADALSRGSSGSGRASNLALMLAFKHPDLFARAGSQAATLEPADLEEFNTPASQRPLVLYLEWGTYHMRSPHEGWDLAADSRALWAHLRAMGYRPAGGEVPEGYSWACWNSHTGELLAALFPMRE